MSLARLRFMAAFALTAGAFAVGVGALTQQDQATAAPRQEAGGKGADKPERADSVTFERTELSADDLVDATGLDIYKFRADLVKGRRFRVVLRIRQDEKSPTRESVGVPFEIKRDEPTTIRVSFLRTDRTLQGFLLSTEPEAEYRVNYSGGASGGFVTIIKNPLGDIDPTLRGLDVHQSDEKNAQEGLKETPLLTVAAQKPGGRGINMSGYPRAEVVVTEDR
jgi:hypothetical protein